MSEKDKLKPWEPDAEGEGSLGGWLRGQRESREITLRDIAENTKISLRYLEALEEDRHEILPAAVFAKGFLREYAKYVGLDPDEVVNRYLASFPEDEPVDDAPTPTAPTSRFPFGLAVAGLTALIGIVALFGWLASRSSNEETPALAAPTPGAEAPAEPVDQRETLPLQVTLDFDQNSWIDVFVDGDRTLSELRVQGESLSIEAERVVRLKLGNVGGVRFEINGASFEPTAGDEEEFTIDLETARQLEGGA
ncbi:MAG: RodZ domain-containing protein [Acidobacteriota bacterium]